MKMRKYLSVSKQITMKQIQELFEDNQEGWEDKVFFDGGNIRRGKSEIKITEDRGGEMEPSVTFDTDMDKNDADLKYIIHCLEFSFGTKIWDYDDLSEMYNLYGRNLL